MRFMKIRDLKVSKDNFFLCILKHILFYDAEMVSQLFSRCKRLLFCGAEKGGSGGGGGGANVEPTLGQSEKER